MKLPFLIGIAGAHSGAGKTTLAAALIKRLRKEPPVYPFEKLPKIGAVKYTKTAFYTSIIDSPSVILQEDKDTATLSQAGAETVLWIQSPPSELEETLTMALAQLSNLDCIVIEGNSAIEFFKPDVVIFLFGDNTNRIKPSAQRLLHFADITLMRNDAENIDGVIKAVENITKEKEIKRLLQGSAVDGTLTCSEARKIAEELGLSYIQAGKAANELKIKIKDCELGCF
jgi:LAO/AO transport system kinase